jgi:GT2 family glycosyltransferase
MRIALPRGALPTMQELTTTRERDCFTPCSLPATSLIICSRNRPKFLLECVQSILQGGDLPTELIIIDQSAASHPVLEKLKTERRCDIRYLWTHSVGVSRARNAGIAAARHDILAFTDDDMLASVSWFGSLIGALIDAGPHTVVIGRVLPTAPEIPGGFAPSTMIEKVPAVYEGRIGKDVLMGNNMAMYRSAIGKVGAFDERLGPGSRFPSSEDNDLGFRLLEAGYCIMYEPKAELYHRAWRTRRDHVRIGWSYGHGQGAYYAKYLSVRDPYMLHRVIRDIMRRIRLFPGRILREPLRACGDAAYIFALAYGGSEWVLTQRNTQ